MIQALTSLDEYMDFIQDVNSDPLFHGPMLSSQQAELYSPKYHDQYVAMHDDSDRFWTAGKVIAAPERFRIILGVENGQAVAYADVTHKYEENELYDIFVKEEYRRRGFGRAMLAKAIELNRPKGLMLLVDGDDGPAIALCKSLGFVQVLGEESVTAYMTL